MAVQVALWLRALLDNFGIMSGGLKTFSHSQIVSY